jgi:hypothetical protein
MESLYIYEENLVKEKDCSEGVAMVPSWHVSKMSNRNRTIRI